MEGGPWLFRGSAVVLEEYDGFSNVHEYKLDKIPVWTRIQGVPEGLMKKKELAEKVVGKVGEPPITVIIQEGFINPLPYLRARVFVNLEKPLVRVIQITLRAKKNYLVQYEKLPVFCRVCGHIGHEMEECGDGVHDASKCQWGEWLLVQFPTNVRGPSKNGISRGGSSMRGRGRGRSAHFDPMTEDEKAEDDMDYNDGRGPNAQGHVASTIF